MEQLSRECGLHPPQIWKLQAAINRHFNPLLTAWLDSIKPGQHYGLRFATAIIAAGYDDVEDLRLSRVRHACHVTRATSRLPRCSYASPLLAPALPKPRRCTSIGDPAGGVQPPAPRVPVRCPGRIPDFERAMYPVQER